MIPHHFQPFIKDVPLLLEITDWKQLKKWDLAAVYRASHTKLGSLIIKWGGHEMATEARNYNELVYPLQLLSPKIYFHYEHEDACIFIMEDLGENNLEQQPEQRFFIEVAKQLAILRKTAIQHLPKLTDEQRQNHTIPLEHFLSLLDDLTYKLTKDDEQNVLTNLKRIFPAHIQYLYKHFPLTIVHHDFMAKNLVVTHDDKVVPIDWSLAYLSPHLGDLACLINEANWLANMDKEAIIDSFLSEYDTTKESLAWELTVGNICWLLKSLRWLTYGGTDIIPGSDAWVPDLFNDLSHLSELLSSDHIRLIK